MQQTKCQVSRHFSSSSKFSHGRKPKNPFQYKSNFKDFKQTMVASIGSTELPRLSQDLEKVLFKRGPQPLTVNDELQFDDRWRRIPDKEDVDWNAMVPFKPPSKDEAILDLVRKGYEQDKSLKYFGSTSSLTSPIGHIIVSLAHLKLYHLPRHFSEAVKQAAPQKFTVRSRAPVSFSLTFKDPGVYAIDAVKFENEATILSELGHVMERYMTTNQQDFEDRYVKGPTQKPCQEENSFVFSRIGGIGVRAQLDCTHPNLPNKVFDLKTRASLALRYDLANYKNRLGYELDDITGAFRSFEREYLDMIRSAFLKYSLQVRMGLMDGIFVAYHNTKEIFGFQYISLKEMDQALYGKAQRGDFAFAHAFSVFNRLLDLITAEHPQESLNCIIQHRGNHSLGVFVADDSYRLRSIYQINFEGNSKDVLKYGIKNVTKSTQDPNYVYERVLNIAKTRKDARIMKWLDPLSKSKKTITN